VSFDLYAWKRPLPSLEDEALALIEGDESAFEPSADVLRFHDELLERYPVLEWDGEAEPDGAPSTWGVPQTGCGKTPPTTRNGRRSWLSGNVALV
jgi:hypothetical protein